VADPLGPGGGLVFADNANSVVRRVLPSGIISRVAGTGTAGYSRCVPDAVAPASVAQLRNPYVLSPSQETTVPQQAPHLMAASMSPLTASEVSSSQVRRGAWGRFRLHATFLDYSLRRLADFMKPLRALCQCCGYHQGLCRDVRNVGLPRGLPATGPAARLNKPTSIAYDGGLFITEQGNQVVRSVPISGQRSRPWRAWQAPRELRGLAASPRQRC